jgi:hypothetical protein
MGDTADFKVNVRPQKTADLALRLIELWFHHPLAGLWQAKGML